MLSRSFLKRIPCGRRFPQSQLVPSVRNGANRSYSTHAASGGSSASSSAAAASTRSGPSSSSNNSAQAQMQGYVTTEEMERIVRLMENDPRILMEMVAHLDPQNRRRLVVTGGAMEWFGKESVQQEVEKAGIDKDRQISPKDFDHWFENALKRKQEEQKKKSEQAKTKTAAVATNAVSPTPATAVAGSLANEIASNARVPVPALFLIALEAALPFVGFGFLDNAIMILAGDAIDGTLGFYLNCSVLASAAMGNVCSGLLGMQLHGLIEKAVERLNFDTPVLTEDQMKDRRVFFAGHLGGTVGIMIGLFLGMFPLLFLDGDTTDKADYAMFQRWDNNESGYIELREFEQILAELGIAQTEEKAKRLIEKYGRDNKVNFEQFSELKDDLREGRPIFD